MARQVSRPASGQNSMALGTRGPLQQIRGSIVSAHRPSLVIVGNKPDLS